MTDFRAANAALEWSSHWAEWMPTIEEMKAAIPSNAKYFFSEDIKDAFEHVKVAIGDEYMLTAAPPIRLTSEDFSDDELEEWGYSPQDK